MGGRRVDGKNDVRFVIGLLVVATVLIVVVMMKFNGDPATVAGPSVTEHSVAATTSPDGGLSAAIERRQPGDPLALGDPRAPVAMVIFSDYRCPFCAKFSRDTEPVLIERFVNDGKLRIEWRDFPIFGEQSRLAALAGRAAADQGKFWEFNRAVYAAAPERSKPDLTEQALIGFARQAGVPDIDRFTSGMHSGAFDAAVDADFAQGNSIGIPSTPAFLIAGRPMLGAQPTADFVQAIDNALNRR
ncbi:thioredoxin domain-containing protein [Mycobacterium sp. 141]|uniref:DsbA family protein n=1 Tax=Mycobacterium sp. 141 TaxID=1120797 RepID=UPI00036A5D69|nr:thioredoxin domain-containing protein [Mycobacterium sp. 141]